MSIDELIKNKPSITDSVILKKRSKFNICMIGDNDYKIVPLQKDQKNTIKTYSDGKTLYINCVAYGAQT